MQILLQLTIKKHEGESEEDVEEQRESGKTPDAYPVPVLIGRNVEVSQYG